MESHLKNNSGASYLMQLLIDGQKKKFLKALQEWYKTRNDDRELFHLDHQGRSILFYVAESGDPEILWAVLDCLPGTGIFCARGALLNIRDHGGMLAEDHALSHNKADLHEIISRERNRIEYCE